MKLFFCLLIRKHATDAASRSERLFRLRSLNSLKGGYIGDSIGDY